MKKTLLVLSTLIISALSLAGTKEDYETAINKYQKSQNAKEFSQELQKIAGNKKTDLYTRQANFLLANFKVQEQKFGDAKVYLNKIVNDKGASKEEKINTYVALAQVATLTNNKNEVLKNVNELVKLDPNNNEFKMNQVVANINVSNISEGEKIYNSIYSKLNEKEKFTLNDSLVKSYVMAKNYSKAKVYANKNAGLSTKELKALGYFNLAQIAYAQKDTKEALKNVLEANRLSDGKNVLILNELAGLYEEQKDYSNALDTYIKITKVYPQKEAYLPVIVYAEKLNKTKLAEDNMKTLLTKLNNEEKKNVNLLVGTTLYSIGEFDKAIKYGNKAVKEDKNNQGYILLSMASALKGNKQDALKYVAEAKKLNVKGAVELEKQILQSK